MAKRPNNKEESASGGQQAPAEGSAFPPGEGHGSPGGRGETTARGVASPGGEYGSAPGAHGSGGSKDQGTADKGQGTSGDRGSAFEDDRLLADEIKARNMDAFAYLVRSFQDRVFNTCFRICGNLDDAKDVSQDVFIRAFEKIGEFRKESRLATWLFRIAVNLSLTHRRKAVRREQPIGALDGDTLGAQADSLIRAARHRGEAEASEGAARRELHGAVARALNALDEEHRTVIVLRDMEGFDYHEIAAILQTPVGTIKSRIHRARMELRKMLPKDLFEA